MKETKKTIRKKVASKAKGTSSIADKSPRKTENLKSNLKMSTRPKIDIKSTLKDKLKSKSVTAEIVDNKNLNLKDVSDKSLAQPLAQPSDSDDTSPLELAAEKAEQAYQNAQDDAFDFDNDLPVAEITPKAKSTSKAIAIAPDNLPKSSDPLAIYLNEIRKYPLLTKEMEKEISIKYFENKDPESAQLLVRSNLRFVVKIAAEYSKFGAKLIDLIQEGNVGLMHAVREFNPYKGARLITYAVWWIRGYIQEYLMRQYSMVRIGTTQNQRKLFYQLQKEKNNLEALSNEKNLSELSERLGIPEDEIKIMAQRLSGRDVSLDKAVDDDNSATLGSFQASGDENLEEAFARQEMIQLLQSKVSELEPGLSEREKIILHERVLNE